MAERRHISRGLRFTLTAAYTGVFTLLLLGVSLLFRHNLATSLDDQAHDDLTQSWAVVKVDLRVDSDPGQSNYHINWHFDEEDPDENAIAAKLKLTSFIADGDGHALTDSLPAYESSSAVSVAQIRRVLQSSQATWLEKADPNGVPYLVRQGYVYDERTHSRKFFVEIGRSLAEERAVLRRFTWQFVGMIPLVILMGGITGWIFTGRALTPVRAIASAAQRISGSNLSLRIPGRGAGDELDYLTETFNQMIGRLEVSFNQVRQFSTDVSHELRTPITVVRGQLEVALFTAETAEQYREAIVNSLSDIERLSQIVRALLLLSQAETGQVVLQKQSLDLVALTDETVDQFQIPAEGANLELVFVPALERCVGDFDRVQIERMLSNLLSNALKFTPAGGRIRVEVGRSGEDAEILVEDNGQGISAEHLPHIFDRFYRVRGLSEQASPEKGLGLGLSFVSWIARAHGGSVEVTSEEGRGTTFRILLPLAIPVPASLSAEAQHEMTRTT